jgi:deoxyribodipyrimidine photo-lyase
MTTPELFSNAPQTVTFTPTRRAGLARLTTFAPRTGTHYANQRNYDFGSGDRSAVSALSPWIKHRLITEEEVLTQTLDRHSLQGSIKFVQEVFWRGYFKGWMQQHPSVWHSYQAGVLRAQQALEQDISRKANYEDAIAGRTGIACFDHWCTELKSSGYLHNHARMWFASIWIFTLRLPWELGADFFLTHLVDGDAAANTLSWRWVGGLHTKGKTYLARPSNIAEFTNGRFDPTGQLSLDAVPLEEDLVHPAVPLVPMSPLPNVDYLLLITPEDCQPETFVAHPPMGVIGLRPADQAHQSVQVSTFAQGALTDAISRSRDTAADVMSIQDWSAPLISAAQKAGVNQIVTAAATIGPIADHLEAAKPALVRAGIHLHLHQRRYDALTWPHATKGFFKLKKKIPIILANLGLSST